MRIEKDAANCLGCDFRSPMGDSLFRCARLDQGIWLIDVCDTGRMVRLPKDAREALALAEKLNAIWAYDRNISTNQN